jgi:hypothetical protein
MKPFEFIKSKLDLLHNKFPFLSIKYQLDNILGDHIVKILPRNTFEYDEMYGEMELDIAMEFRREFPADNLIFISEDSLIDIVSVDFEIFPIDKLAAKWDLPTPETKFNCGVEAFCGELYGDYQYDLAA